MVLKISLILSILFFQVQCNKSDDLQTEEKTISTAIEDPLVSSPYCSVRNQTIQGRTFSYPVPDSFPNLDDYLVCPVILILNKALAHRSIKALNQSDIEFWAEGGTILSVRRFGSFQPWDDDTDLAVDFKTFKKNQIKLQNEMTNQGIEYSQNLKSCLNGTGHCWVILKEEAFKAILLDYFPEISDSQIEDFRKKTFYEGGASLDFFPYKFYEHNFETYAMIMGPWEQSFKDISKRKTGFLKSDMFPLREGFLEDVSIPYQSNYKDYFEAWYGGDRQAEKHLRIYNHSLNSDLSIDIDEHPEVMDYFRAYIEFVFGGS